jgi:hypothetical protein
MKFFNIEIPVAMSMIQLAELAQHPFQKFFSYWAAFNNIYTLIGEHLGMIVQPDLDKDGNPKIDKSWNYIFPKVKTSSEKQQISEAINQLDAQTKDTVIKHPNIHYFVDRTPVGVMSNHDNRGQVINGVLNITRTANPQSPVWSPIEKPAYKSYLAGDITAQEILSEQIVYLLYTIRNNLVHGSKRPDEANDVQVVEMSLPLLQIIVQSFIRP